MCMFTQILPTVNSDLIIFIIFMVVMKTLAVKRVLTISVEFAYRTQYVLTIYELAKKSLACLKRV